MDRVDAYRLARRNYSVIWDKFILMVQKDPTGIFCFFEGDDAKYYGIRIDVLVPNFERKNLECNGKEGVLHLLQLVNAKEEYRETRTVFFVDKDFDDDVTHPKDNKLYVTPCYSIENFYITPVAFAKILRDEFGVSDTDPEYANVISNYCNKMEEFLSAIDELMGWAYLYRRYENDNPQGIRLNLNGINVCALVSINLHQIIKKYSLHDLELKCASNGRIKEADVTTAVNMLSENNRWITYRGKYLIEFLRVYLHKLAEDRNSTSPHFFSERRRAYFNLSRSNIISELTQYAETPSCLREFLNSFCQ